MTGGQPLNPPPEHAKNAQLWSQGTRRRGGEQLMVPKAEFSSYYGRPVVKKPVWEERDIAGYLFTGGVAAGSALLAAGADLTGRDALRRTGRLAGLGAITLSAGALVHDLGRPGRALNMLRVAKVTSPMSVGSWILTAFGLPMGVAAVAELPSLAPSPLRPLLRAVGRPAGLAAAALSPALATYTAVLLADTAVPTWHAAYPELPFVFAGSALVGSAGLALALTPVGDTVPVRTAAVVGAGLELAASRRMEGRLGLVGEPLHEGQAGRRLRLAKALTVAGAAAAVLGRRHRTVAAAAGAALVAASALTRFGIFAAGVASTEDPKYVVTPQRERLRS